MCSKSQGRIKCIYSVVIKAEEKRVLIQMHTLFQTTFCNLPNTVPGS